MKKYLSLFLSLALMLTLQPAPARAAETFAASEEGIALIKEYEGFRAEPYCDDRGNWYIGYGTSCQPEDYPFGITELEADWLLRQAVTEKEKAVNGLLLDYNIYVTQYQFDALVSMTYNLGTQWMNPTYRLCSYLINGIWNYTETEIVNAIATWCHQGTTVLDHVANRRLREAYLFLYGAYDNDGTERYRYIHFDPDGGKVENQTVFYPAGSAYGQLPVPDGSGRTFLGWYTADGTQLTGQEPALTNINVTAKWDGEGSGTASKPDIDLSQWVNPYSDVKSTDWYYTYVRELSAKGVVSGYPDGTFRSGATLTAGEALKLILLAAGYPEQAPTGRHWASGYLTLAEQLGCLGAGEIRNLDEPIARMDIARVTGVALGLEERWGASPFADADSGLLLALYEEGILNGTVIGGKRYYYPDSYINRAEICAVVSRISNWEYQEKNDPSRTGYIAYGGKYYPVKRDAAVCPYDTNLFVLDGSTMYYNDPAYTTAVGVDVSSYQGEIDWQKVADAGVEFAMIRLGYRGYTSGEIFLDKYFRQNLEGARAAGIKVGVYFYSQAISAAEAQEEALFVLENLGGVSLDYPVVYDWEIAPSGTARTAGLDGDTLTDCAIAFCETVAWAGYTPMIYYGLRVGYTMYDLNRLTAYDVWYPQYQTETPSMYYNYRIWQYTDSGKIPGIEGRVDMNLALIPY